MSSDKTRKFETELQINATPEQVWAAVTTPEGITSWFAPEARVNPGENGTVWISWGPGMEGESRIAAWEPGQKFAFTQGRPDGESMVEFQIEAQSGSTLLRLVQSGFGTDAKFDDEYNSTSRAWMLFLFLLRHGLEHPHSTATNLTSLRMLDRSRDELWASLAGGSPTGKVSFDDGVGCRCIEYPDLNHAVTAIFCEKCGGQTALTVMSILYDPQPGDADRLRSEWPKAADSAGSS